MYVLDLETVMKNGCIVKFGATDSHYSFFGSVGFDMQIETEYNGILDGIATFIFNMKTIEDADGVNVVDFSLVTIVMETDDDMVYLTNELEVTEEAQLYMKEILKKEMTRRLIYN